MSELINKCFLCGSTNTYFEKRYNKFKWYNYKNKEKICSFCYYKDYHKQVKEGIFQSYKEKIGLRKCSKCGTDKTYVTITKTGYPHRKWVTDGKGGYLCHNCTKKTIYKERERAYGIKKMVEANPRKLWAQNCIGNHRHNGFDIQLTKLELAEIALKTDKCNICDIPLVWGYLNGKRLNETASLDRINNGKIISKDNIQIICFSCNRTKAARTMKEFIDYCKHVAQKYS